MITSVDVAIIGLGPVGTTLANLLGLYGVQTAVFERDHEIYPHPRAVHADDETLRILQATGLFEALAPALGSYNRREYINAKGEVYFETVVPERKPLGHMTDIYFHQPTMDQVLRDGLARFENISVYTGYEVVAFEQEASHVTLSIQQLSTGSNTHVRAKYVVGCDGARSVVRKAAGIQLTDLGFDQPWLVVDVTLNAGETRESANVPFVHRQYSNPEQPISYIPSGVKGHFRWEFMMRDDVSREEMQTSENVRRLLALVVDPDKFRVDRAAVYTFHSLVAERLRTGRLLIAGDAAHQMPPFAGQGMCCGLRDAHNLAWKLALVLNESAQTHILNSYGQERLPHVTRMTKGTMFLGNLVQTQSRARAWMRDFLFKTIFKIPAIYSRLARFALRPPDLKAGLLGTLTPKATGSRFPQPLVTSNHAPPTLLDNYLGHGFVLLFHQPDHLPLALISSFREAIRGVPLQLITLSSPLSVNESPNDLISIQNEEGVLSSWFETMQADVVLIRPDRYVFDACRLADLKEMLEDLKQHLN